MEARPDAPLRLGTFPGAKMGSPHGKTSASMAVSVVETPSGPETTLENAPEPGHASKEKGPGAGAEIQQEDSSQLESEELLPIRILSPAGEVVLEEELAGSRTVRSVLQSLSTGARGSLTLLHGTEVIPPGRKLSELKITEEDNLCLVRRSITSYTHLAATEPEFRLVKCILIGGPETGKTSWMQGFCREGFPQQYRPTTGVKFKVFPMQSEDGSKLKVQLWDTAGNLPVSNAFYRGAERLANQKGWPFFAISNNSEPFDAPLFALLDLVMMNQDEQSSSHAQAETFDPGRPGYPEGERNHSDPQDLQLFPIRIYTPSGDVLLEQKLPGDRTVRSILQTLHTEKRGRLSLLQGTDVIPQGKKLSQLHLAEDEGLCLVRRATGNYTSWEGNDDAEHRSVKILLVGAAKTGKSTWMLAFGRHGFTSQYQPTIGVEFKLLRLQSEDGLRMRIALWDTAGQQRFRTITNAYYGGSSGIMAFFSLHSRESLTEVLRMLEEAEGRHPLSCRCVCLVGTHVDIPDP
ncbi:GTP-binding protein YPT1 [Symbiodinium microadriaticum]|uniref:GTP-binding protein YPT1 n=1 Tax=Symbiodinium microadriaticum TaxID=2951 RepID=A0A1Q9F5A6_SYMMI|nr:GTP-binding protein YPT1 [Symbiodinium microadriaticum]CAE7337358.1 YPT1 [Symbiodinium sp. KB8]